MINTNRFKNSFFFIFLLLSLNVFSQQYINGNLSTGGLNANSDQAPSGFSWSELQSPNTTLGYPADAGTFLLADDFTVCSNWTLSKVTFFAYVTELSPLTSSPFNKLVFAIYNGDPKAGGAIVYGGTDVVTNNYFSTSYTAGLYRIANANTDYSRQIWKIEVNLSTTLTPGTYWVAYSVGNNNTGVYTSYVPASTLVGSATQAGNNAQQKNVSTGTWTTLADGGRVQDLPFVIDYSVPNCSGTPSPGNTISSVGAGPICTSNTFTLSLTSPNCEAGITNQWQYSTNAGTTWNNISGAISSSLRTNFATAGVPSSASAVLFRDSLRCSFGGLVGYSTPVSITQSSFFNCYCIPGSTNCGALDDILNVKFGGINKTSTTASDCVTGGYVDYTGSVASGNVYSGIPNPMSVTVNGGGTEFVGVWIDYNQNGVFDSNEFTLLGTGTSNTSPIVISGNINIPITALSGKTRMRVRSKFSTTLSSTDVCAAYQFGQTEDYFVNITPAQNCAGVPATGTIISTPSTVCPSTPFTLSLSTYTTLASLIGVEYQWYSSPDGVSNNYSIINGATSVSYSGTQSAATYYKVIATCTIGGSTSTAILLVNMNAIINCYCTPGTTNSNDNDIATNVTYSGINNSTSNSPNNGYSDYTSTVAPAVAYRTAAAPISVTIPSGFSENAAVWIDYDHNGLFDASEFKFLGSTTSAGGIINNTITIPVTAVLGLTRMRVRVRFATQLISTDVCNGYSFGETEDYLVDIRDLVSCSGTPNLGTLSSNYASVCNGENVTITSSNASTLLGSLGLILQWNSSTNGVSGWTIVNGQTTPTLTQTVSNTIYYQLVGTCASNTITSSPIMISLSPSTTCYCASNATASNSSDITNVTVGTLNNTSDCSSVAPGIGTNPNRYSNYTSGVGAPAAAVIYSGTTNTFSVVVGNCTTSGTANAVAIWIDLNKNGVFDATEKLYSSSVTSSTSPRTETGLLNIPATITVGGTDTIRGITRMRIVNSSGNLSAIAACGTYQYGETEDYLVDIQYAPACSGSFKPNITSSFDTVCVGIPITLSVQNATGISGITFQWQSSLDGLTNWTDTIGATNINLVTSLSSSTKYYRVKSTCSGSSINYSDTIKVVLATTGCYCAPTTSNVTVGAITNVTFGGINNTSAYTTGGFTNYSNSVPTGTGTIGGRDSIYVTISAGSGAQEYVAVWIDYNQNGTFETTEYTSIGTNLNGGVLSNVITIPTSALPGLTRMRVRVRRLTALTSGDACTPFTFGETEDYQINLSPCSPVTFDVSPVNTPVVCGNSIYFAVKVISVGTPTYKWQLRTTPTGSWSLVSNGVNYSGATSDTLRLLNVPLTFNNYEYRAVVNGNCILADTSVSGKVSVIPTVSTTFTTNPSNVTVNCGAAATASFSFVVVTGSNPLYQWQTRATATSSWSNVGNNSTFTGATSTTLNLSGITNALNGYQFRAYLVSADCAVSDTTSIATLTVNALVLSLSLSTPNTTVCNGSNVTFTATPTPNSGLLSTLNPIYKYYITNITTCNTANTSTITIPTSNTSQLVVGQTVVITSGRGSFAAGTTIVSIIPGVSFTVSQAPIVNLQVGTVIGMLLGQGSTTFTTSNIAGGNIINCILTVNDACAVPQSAKSNTLTMAVTPNTKDSLTMLSSATTICSGDNVTFTASAYNPGSNPTYEFMVGATSVQGPSPSNVYLNLGTITNNQAVTCKLVPSSDITCPSASPAISNAITMSVNPSYPISVSLAASPGVNVCNATPVTFTATATNPGTSPLYVFYKNNAIIQSSSSNVYNTSSLANNDSIYCMLTSSITTCAPGNPATSNKFKVSITTQLASVILLTTPANACAGDSITYTARPTNGGSSPTYQFYVNGNPVGNIDSTYKYVPSSNDTIKVEMTSSLGCALPNPATAGIRQVLFTKPSTSIGLSTLTCATNAATLDAGASPGSGTISSYQWSSSSSINGIYSNISGATGSTYFSGTALYYKVAVTNSIGCTTNSTAYNLTLPITLAAMQGTYTIGAVTATASGANSGTTINVSSTANLTVGAIVSVVSGTGAFAANTIITSITNATSFVVNVTPSTNLLAGALIAGATCSNYISFKTAFADLNTRAVTASGCTFNVSSGYQENLTARLDLGSAALNTSLSGRTIVFQKSGSGLNPQINAYTGTGLTSGSPDGMIALNGIDNITFDGINLNDANTVSTTTMMEYGYGLFRLSATDGAQNNTFKNCKISLNKNNNVLGTAPMSDGSIGILSINALVGAATTAITTVGTVGANSNNKIYNDSIINCNYGVVFTGIAATGGGTAPADGDFGNDIGGATIATGNWILNFGGATGATVGAGGVQANNQWGMNISNNILNNNLTIAGVAGVNHPAKLVGIWGKAGTSANVTINNNNINLTSTAVNYNLEGINNAIGNTVASNTVNINNNTFTGSLIPASATTGNLFGIHNTAIATNVNMNGNTVQNCAYASLSNTGTGVFYPLYNFTGGCLNVNMNSNTVSNNTIYSNATTTPVPYIGSANVNATPTPSISISNNIITNNTRYVGSSGTRVSMLYIANCALGTATVSTNNISNNSFYMNGTSTNTLTLDNIYVGTDSISNITANTISNNGIYNTVPSATGVMTLYGIYSLSNTVYNLSSIANETISNNTINKLFVSTSSISSTGAHVIYGIFSQGGLTSKGGKSIFNNQIDNLYTNTNYNGKIYGIYNTYGATVNIYKNKISSFWPGQSSVANISFAEGIYLGNSSTNTGINNTTSLYNNMIALDYSGATSIAGASSGVVNSTSEALRGIDIASTTANSTIRLYHNTVRLAGTGVGNFSSSALYQTANANVAYKATLDMRNNIFVNECTPVGSGLSVAYRRSSNNVSPGQDSSVNNNNVFYAGASFPFRYLHYDITAKDSTISQLKTTFGPIRDSASRSFLPVFVSNTDLHIQSCAQINTDSIESKGVQILTPVMDKDIDDETRTLATPDIGADEFTGTSFGGRVTNNISICSGSNSGVLNLVGTSGTVSVTEWQSSTDSLAWSSVPTTAGLTSYTSGHLTQTTWFRAVILSVTCNNNSANSLPVKVTVNSSPQISTTAAAGPYVTTANVCIGSSIQLYGTATASGSSPWISASTGVAAINTTTGVAVGVSAGTSVITYANNNGCSSTLTLTVASSPSNITGANSVCVGGSSITLSGTSATSWTSSNLAVATINSSGILSPVGAGSTNITYSNAGGCTSATYIVTVLARPTISGVASLCASSSITLTGSPTAAASNPWVSDNAIVTISGSGFVTAGNTAGSSNITYTNSNGCASLPYPISVNTAPSVSLTSGGASITTANVCKSSTLQLYGTATAAADPWSTSNPGIATITTGGLITPVVAGTCSITYTNNNTCTKTITFKVDTIPSGPTSVTNAKRCGTGSVILSATAPSGLTIDWFANASGGVALSGGSLLYSTPSILTTTIYYAQTRNTTTGCTSATPRTAVTATIGILGTWLGVNNNWSDASNWCNGIPPTSSDNVIIPTGLTTYPTITNSATCKDITLENGASLTINGSGKLTIYGTSSSFSAGQMNVTDGTLEFAGSTAQTIIPVMFVSTSIKNLIINNATVNLSGALTLTGKLSFAGSGRRFNTNSNLVLKSDSASTASVGNIEKDANTGAVISGNLIAGKVSVERYISGAKKAWRLLSSPTVHLNQTIRQAWMEGGSANSNPTSGYGIQTTSNLGSNLAGARALGFDTITPAGPSIKVYNSAAVSFDGIATTDANFMPGKAYMTFIRGDRSVTRYNQPSKPTRIREKDSLNMGDFTVSNLGTNGGQFAAVGNPYASAISLTNLTKTNLDSTYYFWDPKLGTATEFGGYQTLSVFNGVPTVTPAGASYSSGNKNVESGQGFFVRTNNGIGSITFKESNKVDGSNLVARPPVSSFRSFRTNILRVQNGISDLVDGVVNVYDAAFSNDVDASDAIKFKNSLENLAINNSAGSQLAIERRNAINNNDTIFYKLNQVRVSNYQFEFTPEYLDDLGLEAYLEDSYLNTKTPLSLSTSSIIDFNIINDPRSYNPDRFSVVFKVLRIVPVTFVDVNAIKQEQNVLVSWSVQNEININKYAIERSDDGIHFSAIGNKTATNASSYSFLDEQAIVGVNYYRIRSEDISGDLKYSKIVKVVFESIPSITIYPNPVKEDRMLHLKLSNVQKGVLQIRMVNHLGQKVMAKTISHNGGREEYLLSIPKSIMHGHYTMEVIDEQNLKTILKLLL